MTARLDVRLVPSPAAPPRVALPPVPAPRGAPEDAVVAPVGRGGTPGERVPGDRTSGERAAGERLPGDPASDERGPGERPPGDRAPADRAPGDRTPGDRTPGDRAARAARAARAEDAAPSRCVPTLQRLGGAAVPAYTHAGDDRAGVRPEQAVTPAHGRWGTGPVATLDPRQACCMLALAAVEVLAGTRPLAQLARWVTPEVYDDLARRAGGSGAAVLDPCGRPRRAAPGADGAPVHRPAVRRVRACPVGRDAVEASVVVVHAQRVRAVAVRLVQGHGRWRATALVVG